MAINNVLLAAIVYEKYVYILLCKKGNNLLLDSIETVTGTHFCWSPLLRGGNSLYYRVVQSVKISKILPIGSNLSIVRLSSSYVMNMFLREKWARQFLRRTTSWTLMWAAKSISQRWNTSCNSGLLLNWCISSYSAFLLHSKRYLRRPRIVQ